MLDVFNTPTSQTANYQEFFGGANGNIRTWVKPRGASMVRIMLIGGGGGGANGTGTSGGGGGGSGAVTSWIGPAIFIPDILNIRVGSGGVANSSGDPCYIYYRASNGDNLLLRADGGTGSTGTSGGNGASAMTANQFTASGIFKSTNGQNGSNGSATTIGASVTASTTTFLSGGAGGSGGSTSSGGGVTPNFGYTRLPTTPNGGTVAGANGYFITQPILVGCGGAGGTTSTSIGSAGGQGGIGCGGGGAGEDATTGGGRGGDGAVFVWAW